MIEESSYIWPYRNYRKRNYVGKAKDSQVNLFPRIQGEAHQVHGFLHSKGRSMTCKIAPVPSGTVEGCPVMPQPIQSSLKFSLVPLHVFDSSRMYVAVLAMYVTFHKSLESNTYHTTQSGITKCQPQTKPY